MSDPSARQFASELLAGVKECILAAVRPANSSIMKLHARVKTLEGELKDVRQLRYCGVFREKQLYRKGNFITHSGSLWHCNKDTTTKPGDASGDWTLSVKGFR